MGIAVPSFLDDLAELGEKVGGGDGIELRGGLVKNQDLRVHRHNRSRIVSTNQVINDFLLINPYFLDNTTPYSTFLIPSPMQTTKAVQ